MTYTLTYTEDIAWERNGEYDTPWRVKNLLALRPYLATSPMRQARTTAHCNLDLCRVSSSRGASASGLPNYHQHRRARVQNPLRTTTLLSFSFLNSSFLQFAHPAYPSCADSHLSAKNLAKTFREARARVHEHAGRVDVQARVDSAMTKSV